MRNAMPRKLNILVLGFAAWALIHSSLANAAIAYRASAKTSVGVFVSPTTLTINKPAGTVSGDVLIASIAVGTKGTNPTTTVTITPPSGWTLILRTNQTSSNKSALASYYKVAGASEPASYSFTIAATTNDGAVGGIAGFSGVDTSGTSPIDVSAGQLNVSNKTQGAPSVTTTMAGDMLVTVHEYSSSGTWTPPTGMTESVDTASRTPNNAAGIAMEMNYQTIAAAGATGTRTATASTSKDRGAGQSIALKAPAALHHIRIEHDGSASTCSPESITIKACANSSCTAPYYTATDVTGINLSPTSAGYTWSPSSTVTIAASSGGTNSLITLARSSSGSATLAITGTPSPAPSNAYECYNTATGTSGSCTLTYSGNFSFNIPDHTSATRNVVTLTSCTSSFASQTRTVKFWSTYSDPSTGTKQGAIVAGTGNSNCSTGYSALGTSSAGATSLNLTFGTGTSPQATFSLCYPDVGSVRVDARYDGSAATGDTGVVILGNDSFIAKPDHFTTTNIKRTSDNFANPGASTAADAAFVSAGDSTTSAARFTATVTAVNALGATTPNFGLESSPEGVTITSTLVAPSGGNSGTLTCKGSTADCVVPGGSTNFSSGATTITDMAWDDVGIITVLPRLTDLNYMGTGPIPNPTSSGNIGRFRANQLVVVPGSASLQARADLASPAACVATATASDTGDTVSGSTTMSGLSDASPFSVGDNVVVVGAGTGGADLYTTLTAVDTTTDSLTLANAASTTLSDTAVFERAPFTYMGEPILLSFQLNALNAAGDVVQNYDSTLGFDKLTAGTVTSLGVNDSWGLWGTVNQLYGVSGCRALFASTSTYNTTYSPAGCASQPASGYSATAARISASSPSASWSSGIGTLSTQVTLNSASQADGVFDWLGLGILPQDADGALTTTTKDFDADSTAGVDRIRVGAAQVYYGRARMLNANGTELLDLPMTFREEYWASSTNGWQVNTSDSCTSASLAFSAVGTDITGFTCVRDTGNPGNSGAGCSAAGVSSRQYKEGGVAGFAGDHNLWLQAPGSGHAGTVLVTATVPSWLRYNWNGTTGNPSARATFGIAKSGKVIFRRERY